MRMMVILTMMMVIMVVMMVGDVGREIVGEGEGVHGLSAARQNSRPLVCPRVSKKGRGFLETMLGFC